MARLYANENFPLPVVRELRALGHEVLTSQESGRGQQAIPDDRVLELACEDGRAILTLNRKHFVRFHRARPHHRGIIVCTFDPDFARQARQIHEAIVALSTLDGELVRVNRPS